MHALYPNLDAAKLLRMHMVCCLHKAAAAAKWHQRPLLSCGVLVACSFGADVWDEDPPSASHPWRLLPRSATTPHMAGLTIDAQVQSHKCTPGTTTAFVHTCAGAAVRLMRAFIEDAVHANRSAAPG